MSGIQRLEPCPDKSNCVCTTATDDRHAIRPIGLAKGKFESGADFDSEEVMSQIAFVVEQTGGSIVERTKSYLRAEYRSRLFRFVDDVEFVVEPASQTIHFRSASRTGVSDFGVNRKRMERFRKQFIASATS